MWAVMEIYEQKARAAGLEEGRAEGENKLNKLLKILIDNNRYKDIEEMTQSMEYRQKLYKEFGIV